MLKDQLHACLYFFGQQATQSEHCKAWLMKWDSWKESVLPLWPKWILSIQCENTYKKKKKASIGQCELWFMWIINTLLKTLIFICLLHFCGEVISPGVGKGSCTLYIKITQYMHFIWRGGASYLVTPINRHWINQCLCKNINNICTCLIANWCMTDEQHSEYLPWSILLSFLCMDM